MKSPFGSKALFVIAIILIGLEPAWSQKANGSSAPKYDPTNEVKIKGTIEEIKLVPGALEGVHATLKATDQSIVIHIAPEKFLKEMESEFAKGDQIEVLGCKIKAEDGSEELLARQVTKNGNELLLRDKKGTPIWAGWNPGKK